MSLFTCRSSPQTYTEDIALEKQDKELSDEVKELLAVYHKTFDDDKVNIKINENCNMIYGYTREQMNEWLGFQMTDWPIDLMDE